MRQLAWLKRFFRPLHMQILAALVLAVIAGQLSGTDAGLFGVTFYSIYDFFGRLFLNALQMLIVPLVAASIITGMSSIGKSGRLGGVGAKTLIFYIVTTLLAVLVGLALVNAVQPGLSNGRPVGEQLSLDASSAQVAHNIKSGSASDVVDVFIRMVPPNILDAATSNNAILAVIFFSILFGFFMTRVSGKPGETLRNFWQGVFEVMMKMTHWVMLFSPIGVFALVAKVVAETGFAAALPLVIFALTVVAALLVQSLLVLPGLLYFIGRVNPWKMYRALSPPLWIAFSTASSNAALPSNMECTEKNVGVSERITNFVLPLGATVNQNGSALYECVAALFLAQAYGVELTFATQFTVVVLALVTSMGVAGVPAASLVAITLIMSVIGVPLEAIGVLFVFDRILDMMRTAVNVFGDSAGAVVVARLEGETDFKVSTVPG
ncbi:MAG: dicarboxylate/amino acid:cation symporter [Gammaproteobacteria bacterium]|nr:dicarboxylate/amino acid:cation symporter [Gammaproteobacteria bacterium]